MFEGFNSQPTLRGQNLLLRPLTPEDYPSLYKVAADPLLWQGHPAKDRYQEDQFKVFFDEALKSKGALLALDIESAEVVGTSRFFPYPKDTNQLEIGWSFLARSHWGGKTNAEMKWLMINHVFRDFDRVYFRVDATNLRSQKSILKIGATQIDSNVSATGEEWFHYCIRRDDVDPG